MLPLDRSADEASDQASDQVPDEEADTRAADGASADGAVAPEEPARMRGSHRARIRPRQRLWLVDVGAALFYSAAAVAVMRLLWASPAGRTPAANRSDQIWFEWMLLHAVRIFTHGENPFRTDLLNVPTGVNLLANTHALGLTIPMVPVTLWFGPATAFVLILTVGLAGTAYAWYHVLSRHLIGSRTGAFAGGLICGFGPGMIAHANGHPNITAQFLVPFIVWRALAMRFSARPWRDGAILAALVVLQASINEEILLDTALAVIVFILAYVIFRPSSFRAYARPMLAGAGTTVLFAGLALAYPLWLQFTGPGHVTGLPLYQEEFPYNLPLATFVRLPTLSPWGDPTANAVLAHPAEENSFFGWPMVILALLIVVAMWRRSVAVRAMSVVGVLFAWASLGNQVMVGNPDLAYAYSLWSHVSALPVFNSVLPTRLALVVLAVVGILVAMGTAAACRRLAPAWPSERPAAIRTTGPHRGLRPRPTMTIPRSLRVRFGATADRAGRRVRHRVAGRVAGTTGLVLIAGTLVTLIPRAMPTVDQEPVPRFFTDGTFRRYVPDGYTVLSATPSDRVGYMAWSIATDLAFGVPGGYFLGPDETGRARFGPVTRPTMTILKAVGVGVPHHNPAAATKQNAIADIRYWRTSVVVLAPGKSYEGELIVTLDKLFGPGRYVDDVWLWDVRTLTDGTAATYRGVAGLAGRPPATATR